MIAFAAEVMAVQYFNNLPEVMAFLGYEVRDGKIVFPNTPMKDVPNVSLDHWLGEQPQLTLHMFNGKDQTLETGDWLVKIGGGWGVLTDDEFQKIRVLI